MMESVSGSAPVAAKDFSDRGSRRVREPLERDERPKIVPFDPEPQREKLRGWIAVGLVVLFALAIAASFLSFWWLPDKTDDLKDFLPLVLTPLTSVVSAVVGFYYGAQTRRGD
ncbi:MAG: hypothetical protein KatS3mg117_1880 [Geminicoccaceae bacterium]|jgi:hypothetical protein|nr:MAG: hypothetical protein KatS3mg117_1880 [Geminicoccaceae bacterium]